MPETLTPVSQYNNTNPTIAEPGDIGGMQTGPAPMKPVLQKVFDRVAFALLAVSGALVWSEELSVESVVSSSNFAVRIGAIQSVVIAAADGATYDVFFYAGGTIGASKIEGTPGSLDADSWYYVYAIPGASPGAACDFEISLTAPRANRVFKTGSGFAYQSRRYLGCFRTDSTGAPFPMRMTRGRAIYRRSSIATVTSALDSDGFRALDTTGTHSIGSIDLSKRLPPHARVALLHGQVSASSTGSGGAASLKLYSADDTTVSSIDITANASSTSGDSSTNSAAAEIETTSAQAVGYAVTNATFGVAYQLDVMGWLE